MIDPARGLDQAREALDERRLPRAAAPDDRDGRPGRDVERDALEDRRRLGAAVPEPDVAEADRAVERPDRLAAASGPRPARAPARRRRSGGSGAPTASWNSSHIDTSSCSGPFASRTRALNDTSSADREVPVQHLMRADPEEQRERHERDEVDRALEDHDREVGAEQPARQARGTGPATATAARSSAPIDLTVSMPLIASI